MTPLDERTLKDVVDVLSAMSITQRRHEEHFGSNKDWYSATCHRFMAEGLDKAVQVIQYMVDHPNKLAAKCVKAKGRGR